MSVLKQFIPIRPRAGGLVHATSMTDPTRTACGDKCGGWIIEPKRLSCSVCRDRVHVPVKRAKKRREVRA